MPKLKTKKTLTKRIKITSTGKILRKQSNIGHLKSKWGSARKFRKRLRLIQKNRGHIKKLKTLMAKRGKRIS